MNVDGNGAGPSSGNRASERRHRPNSYTSHACDRCRSRKQRCLLQDENDEICRNCQMSGSTCVFAPRAEVYKRSRITTSSNPDDNGAAGQFDDESFTTPSPAQSTTSGSTKRRLGTRNAEVTKDHNPIPQADGLMNLGMGPPHGGSNNNTTVWNQWPPNENGRTGTQPQQAETFDWTSLMAFPTNSNSTASQNTNAAQMQSQVTVAGGQAYAISNQPQVNMNMKHDKHHHRDMSGTQTAVPKPGSSRSLPSPAQPKSPNEEQPIFEAAKGLAMISLEASAEPHYIGESSGFLWSTIVGKGMYGYISEQTHDQMRHANGPATNRPPSPTHHRLLLTNLQRVIPDHIANHVLEVVFQHLHARYPFIDWLQFDQHWQAREGLLLAAALGRPLNKDAAVAVFFILMVLAIGAQICKNENLPGLLRPEEYYALAQSFLPIIVQLHNLANIQGLLLLAMYSLRDSRGPSIWYLSGVTMRLCIGLGLHRTPAARALENMSPYSAEIRKRVFWTCYVLDRMMVMMLGRPPGISDDDIDVDLPQPLSEELVISVPALRVQSMVSAVHYMKLKRIESQIQRSIFTVSAARNKGNVAAVSRMLLQEIDQWENDIPVEASLDGCKTLPCCSNDWFLLRGIEARLHLLRPLCTGSAEDVKSFLPLLARNAARGCELQKRTHHSGQPGSNTSALSTFICGLALLYAVFLQADILPLKVVFNAIRAASSTLFAYSQSDGTAVVLHDVFEDLSSASIDTLTNGPSGDQGDGNGQDANNWQKASEEATSNLDPSVANSYVDFLQTLGISSGDDQALATNPFTDSLWDLAIFSPGNAGMSNSFHGFMGNVSQGDGL